MNYYGLACISSLCKTKCPLKDYFFYKVRTFFYECNECKFIKFIFSS